MLSILFIYFHHYHDFKTLGFIYFVGLKKYTGSDWSMQPNVEFRVELPKTNPALAKSHLQRHVAMHKKGPLTHTKNVLIRFLII